MPTTDAQWHEAIQEDLAAYRSGDPHRMRTAHEALGALLAEDDKDRIAAMQQAAAEEQQR